ncbi:hypothetical protein [Pedobacter sp. MW01-1-1]|uniref:hypothetical protein n=1 Tax=Pedobacter sp. MW01-1-1 TaxID=3383027 RepID=UPI003FEDACAD
MKKKITSLLSVIALAVIISLPAAAQQTAKEKKEVKSNAITKKSAEIDKLVKPSNTKTAAAPKTRGDVYGPKYSDIVVKNFTGYYIDIYVDGNYRTTVSPGYSITTWAIPGTTKLYAKAVFSDGSYSYWGPEYPVTGYQYTWSLYK